MEDRDEIIFQLREQLHDAGYNLSSYARAIGKDPAIVIRTVHRFWGTPLKPRGIIQRRILRGIEAIIHKPACCQRESSVNVS
jgi:hypothetical protein